MSKSDPAALPQTSRPFALLAAAFVGNMFVCALVLLGLLWLTSRLLGVEWVVFPVSMAYALFMVVDLLLLKRHTSAKCYWPAFNSYGLWPAVFSYFRTRHEIHAELDDSKQYIIQVGPHSIHCWALALFSWWDGPFRKRFPGLKLTGLVAKVIFYIPVLRDIFIWSGYVDASRSVAERCLRNGHSLFICTGGEAESLLTEYGKDRLVLKTRRGFVRLALKFGASIVPTYAFNACHLYHTIPFATGFRKWLSKSYQIALPLFYGRWFSAIPLPATMTVITGKPFDIPQPPSKDYEPSRELVEETLQRYIEHVTTFYDEHKERLGFKDHTLEIH